MGIPLNLEKLYDITHGLNRRFPDGNDPFKMMARLLEEGGELAQMVNHFEGTGIKREKYGEPDKSKLAKEVMDLLRCALQIVIFYEIEGDLEQKINDSYEKMKTEGLTKQ